MEEQKDLVFDITEDLYSEEYHRQHTKAAGESNSGCSRKTRVRQKMVG
jgi:hypothetical protein